MSLEDSILDNFLSEARLAGEKCHLKHGDDEHRPAVDYLCHQMGYQLPDGTYEADTELRVPICAECVDALVGNEWILFYCVECTESQWMLKSKAKREYPEDTNIIALRSCPKCCNELLD